MSQDYVYDFTLISRWSTFSDSVSLCNINCVIFSDTHRSFGPPIVGQLGVRTGKITKMAWEKFAIIHDFI